MEICKYLISKGYTPPVFKSGNLPGGDEYNKHLVEEYTGKAIVLILERNGERDDFWHMLDGKFCSEAWDAISRYIYTAL